MVFVCHLWFVPLGSGVRFWSKLLVCCLGLWTLSDAMRVAVERLLGAMDEKDEPSPDYLAVKLEEVEGGDLLASTLHEVGCVKDDLHG